MQDGSGSEDKLMANTATELTSRWLLGLKLVDESMQGDVPVSKESMKEWQCLVPFMVRSFQIARDMVQKVTFSDQATLDRVCLSGLALPLRFLLPFGDSDGDVTAKWRLQFTLLAARILLNQKRNQTEAIVLAADPPIPYLTPSHAVHLSILQAAAALIIGED